MKNIYDEILEYYNSSGFLSDEEIEIYLNIYYPNISKEEKEKIFNKFNIWDCKDIDYFSN